MTNRITAQLVKDRLNNYPRENYVYIGTIMKGVALYFASIVMLDILRVDTLAEWMKLLPWLASLAAILVSYMTTSRGVVLTSARANIRDSLIPLLMGISEFLLFSVLQKNQDYPNFWLNWFGFVFLHSVLAVVLIQNRIKETVPVDFEGNLELLRAEFVRWLTRDRKGACGFALAALFFWLVIRRWLYPVYGAATAGLWQSILSMPFLFGFLAICRGANSERTLIEVSVARTSAEPQETVAELPLKAVS